MQVVWIFTICPIGRPQRPRRGQCGLSAARCPQGDGLGALGPSPAALGVFLVNEADSARSQPRTDALRAQIERVDGMTDEEREQQAQRDERRSLQKTR